MKPIKLSVQAFGSFADRTEIDFTKFHGIFLVTGDTGAGKTTVFDGIAFALFGEASGSEGRNKSNLRSDYVPADMETWAELTFLLRGETYTVTRSPEYQRAKLRGEGTTTHPPSATLLRGEQVLATKATEVTERIEKLLGVNASQFRQIAMIAQGEFMTILRADSKKRSQLFRELFGTEKYEKFQLELKEQARQLRRESETELQVLLSLTQRLHFLPPFDEDEALRTWQEHPGMDTLPGLQDTLARQLTAQVDMCREAREALEPQEAREAEQRTQLGAAQVLHGRFETLRGSRRRLEEQEARQGEMEALRQATLRGETALYTLRPLWEQRDQANQELRMWHAKVEQAQKLGQEAAAMQERVDRTMLLLKEKEADYQSFGREIAALEPQLDQYATLAKLEKDAKAYAAQQQDQQEALKRCEQELCDAQKRKEQLDAQAAALPELVEACAEVKRQTERMAQRALLAKEWASKVREEQKLTDSLESLQKAYEQRRVQHEEKEEHAAALRDLFLREQAGVLARDALVEGSPCPVCGSVQHPRIATLPGHAPSREAVEAAEAEARRAAAEESDASHAAGLCREKIEATRKRQDELQAALDWQDTLKALEKALVAEKEALTRRDAETSAREAVSRQAAEETGRLTKTLNLLQSRQEKERQQLTELQSCASAARARWETLAGQLVFPTEAAAQERFQLLRRNRMAYEKKQEEALALRNEAERQTEAAKTEKRTCGEMEDRAHELLSHAETLWQEALAREEFPDEGAYRSALPGSVAALKQEKARLEAWEQQLRQARHDVEQLTEELQGKQDVELEQLTEQVREAAEQTALLRSTLTEQERRYQDNRAMEQELTQRYAAGKELLSRTERMKRLSDLASGDDATRLSFEVYLQRTWFGQVIERANLRMGRMTDGVLLLTLEAPNPGQKKTGLELNVFDAATGRERSAATLSGGESFKASLALALGMSELISEIAGGVRLDAMFIDEGFGTLDDASLDQALDVLSELSLGQRLTAVISHRPELRERIPQKLWVTKGAAGSRVRVEGEE